MKVGIAAASLLILWTSFARVDSQSASKSTPEPNLPLHFEKCTPDHGCKKVPGGITLDANWRAVKDSASGRKDCLNGNGTKGWDKTLCPDPETCAQNCALDSIDYHKQRISTNGRDGNHDSVTLKLFKEDARNTGSRIYLLDASHQRYEMFFLLNQELSFDVDVSQSSCGVASGIYFSAMQADGGMSSTNQAGAKYGTGYCDAQGPRDMHFVDGKANLAVGSGGGDEVGYACPELDVWEANRISQAYTVHNCQDEQARLCHGAKCGGLCDGSGCDYASFRMGNTSFYGPSKIVDTAKKFTVVTQFITADNTDRGELVEIRRFYRQDGRLIPNSRVNLPNASPFDSITDEFCQQMESVVGHAKGFRTLGGLRKMGASMRNGMVLVMTVWADQVRGMSWLDGQNPDKNDAGVEFSNIRVGPIGSTSEP
ncbi:hypothetical protein PtA15_17A246 [Puccinia triticina]|uniref:Glucanase n=1 Tax=Puccinia triticina TaxID=208348 RepID=A0ABY7D574_9BASI|nr:uncharacterized protein PtA15_17A246 [Puccinia triticina]WAQ92764.1 hypothetical protein PtA15_17A246 [Puccinia triticina]